MDSSLILKINFDGRSKLIQVTEDTTFQNITDVIRRKWPSICPGKYSFLYSVGEIKNCCLDGDSDFDSMKDYCIMTSEKLVNISIEIVEDVIQSDAVEPLTGNSMLGYEGNANTFDINSQESYLDRTQNNLSNKDFILSDSQTSVSNEFVGLGSLPLFDICPSEKKKSYLSDHWMDLMKVGATFSGGAPEFRVELIKYCTKLNFKFTYLKNCPRYVYAECREKATFNCSWFVKAKQSALKNGFVVHKANLVHTCVGNLLDGDKGRFGPKIIKELVIDSVKSNPNIRGKSIIDGINVDYGFSIPYYKAWRGIEAARDDIFGSYDESYDQLRWYGEAVKRTNPGSVVDLEIDSTTHHFERIFISFYACKEGFKHCRPMLFIDGTFMKGRAKGVLLIATAKDGDNGLFPVAFSVVSAENKSNWTWFLHKIKDCIFHPKQIIFISDRNPGLMSAFYDVWENPPHFYCLFHLIMNLKGRYGGGWNTQHRENMADLFKQCAYAPNVRIFDDKLKKFKEVGGRIAEIWLEDLPYSHWAVSHSPNIKRYGEMTSNAAESFNSWIRESRGLPITHMIDSIRSKLSKWFVDRRIDSSNWSGLLVPSKEDIWNEHANISASWRVNVYPNGQFQVASKTSVTVDLEQKFCSCFQWQVTGFPCAHAVAVIKRYCSSINNVVEDCFMVSNYKQCYKVDLMPVPETEKYEWKPTMDSEKVLPPILNKPPGRPRQKRITSYGEFRRVKPTNCSICGKKGRHDPLMCAAVFGNDVTNIYK